MGCECARCPCSRARCALAALLVLLGALGSTIIGVNTLGKAIAAAGIKQAAISFSLIDVGNISGKHILHPRVVGRLSRPSPFSARVRVGTAVVTALDLDGRLAEVGTARLPEMLVRGNQDMDIDIVIEFEVKNLTAFGHMGRDFIAASRTSWCLAASVDVLCWVLGFIPVRLRGIPFEKSVALQGMNGFSQETNPVTMRALRSAYGRPGVLEVGVDINLYNPSYFSARVVPQARFNITQRGRPFGVATTRDVTIRPGRNVISVQFALSDRPGNRRAVAAFVLGYMKAEMQSVALVGSEWSALSPILKILLDGLSMQFIFEPPRSQFIQGVEADIGFSGLTAIARVFNPLPANVIIDSLMLQIDEGSVGGEQVFLLDTSRSNTRIPGQVLGPATPTDLHIRLSLLDAHLMDPFQVARLMQDAREGRIRVGVAGPITVVVAPAFRLAVEYSANNITCLVRCPIWCGMAGAGGGRGERPGILLRD